MDPLIGNEIKIETIETSLFEDETLNYDYKCTFMQYFGIIDLITPNISFTKYEIEKYYIHNNIVVLIIESMALGIVMNLHLAKKFKYIDNAIKYKDYSVIFEDGMKIIKISEKWDTSLWSYFKLKNFYNWVEIIENKSCTIIEADIKRQTEISVVKYNTLYDIHFLNSLCWNTHLN